MEADPRFAFHAGQYVAVRHPKGTVIPFSVATPPAALPRFEIHYRPMPDDANAPLMDEVLASADALEIDGPFGTVRLPAGSAPLVFICGGTGIAQALSMAIQASVDTPTRSTTIVWCVDDPSVRYDAATHAIDAMRQDALTTVLLTDASRGDDNAVLAWLRSHEETLAAAHVFLCGSVSFVYACADVIEAITTQSLSSDVFDYAPRSGSGNDGSQSSD